MTTSLGICVGATTVSAVKIAPFHPTETENTDLAFGEFQVVTTIVRPHGGDLRKTLSAVIKDIDLSETKKIGVTGRKFRHLINLPAISEPEAVEHAYRHTKPPDVHCPAIVSAGVETFMVY